MEFFSAGTAASTWPKPPMLPLRLMIPNRKPNTIINAESASV